MLRGQRYGTCLALHLHLEVLLTRSPQPGLCLVFGLRDGRRGGEGGYEGKRKVVHLKWDSPFWLPIQNFISHHRKVFLVLGGWVVWPGGGGSARSPPPPLWMRTSLTTSHHRLQAMPPVKGNEWRLQCCRGKGNAIRPPFVWCSPVFVGGFAMFGDGVWAMGKGGFGMCFVRLGTLCWLVLGGWV